MCILLASELPSTRANMNADSLLESVCREILGVINPLTGDCTVRLQLIDQLEAAISSVESLRGTAFCYSYAFFSS